MERDQGMAERARVAWLAGAPDATRLTSEIMADFALSESRRAVREELESLRAWLGSSVAYFPHGATGYEIDRRLAALGGNDKPSAEGAGPARPSGPEHNGPEAAPTLATPSATSTPCASPPARPSEQPNSRPAPPATDCPASEGAAAQGVADRAIPARELTRSATPDLTEPEILERAAEILRETLPDTAGVLRLSAQDLRASAAAPAQDWAEKLSTEWDSEVHNQRSFAEFVRERLGPVVEYAEYRQVYDAAAQAALRKLEAP